MLSKSLASRPRPWVDILEIFRNGLENESVKLLVHIRKGVPFVIKSIKILRAPKYKFKSNKVRLNFESSI